MGKNKALLTVDCEPLWQRQLRVLAEAGISAALVSVRAGREEWLPADLRRVTDEGESGPPGGIAAAWKAVSSTHLAVVAVDLPYLPVSWLRRLLNLSRPGLGAVGWNERRNAFEPLAAVYPCEMAEAFLRAGRDAGKVSLQVILRDAVSAGLLQRVPIRPEELTWFENWNRPEDIR